MATIDQLSRPEDSLFRFFMVYFTNWDTFVSESSKLYAASPAQTRYCTKWRHEPGLLVLKVTDDSKCLKFTTRSAVYLNRFELMTRAMIQQMHNAQAIGEPEGAAKAGAASKPKDLASASGPPPLSSAAREAGKQPPGPKKKKGKKKN